MLPQEKEIKPSWIGRVLTWILRAGEIPHHVAFIMDGNRRFARRTGDAPIHGHKQGFSKLAEVLSWCEMLSIPEVTVYAFSADNFKRPQAEVDGLMTLAREKFLQLLSEQAKLKEKGVRIRMIGEIDLLPADVRQPAAELEQKTRNNNSYTLNICIAYTSRLECVNAAKKLLHAFETSKGLAIDEQLVSKSMYLSSPPQLLIRTSGEARLSDFLLFQCQKAQICFVAPFWPDFSLYDFLGCLLKYQKADTHSVYEEPLSSIQESYLRKLQESRAKQLSSYLK
ncbi:unnamed protein product [Oikopleura dioica]|uniref:Alkyl transferase n=1 Tax=Oikopleura dioica TaxID=34765 RepID=E4XDU5_OIKDI|nr:unnamed protein product [Oikopleura dioica]